VAVELAATPKAPNITAASSQLIILFNISLPSFWAAACSLSLLDATALNASALLDASGLT
jgi:hypothetical protein